MQIFTKELLESETITSVKKEAVFLYLLCRAQDVYYGAVEYENVVTQSGLNSTTVKRHFDTLKRLNWVKVVDDNIILKTADDYFLDLILQAGVKKYETKKKRDEKVILNNVQKARIKMEDDQKNISAIQIAKPMGKKPEKKVSKGTATALFNRFKELYEMKFGEECKQFADGKTLTYMGRPLKWTNNDYDYVDKVFVFLFENWTKLKGKLGISDPRPTISIIGSSIHWNRVREFHDSGRLGVSLKDRVSTGQVEGDGLTDW